MSKIPNSTKSKDNANKTPGESKKSSKKTAGMRPRRTQIRQPEQREIKIVPFDGIDGENFGDFKLIQSQTKISRQWGTLKSLPSKIGEDVWIRPRIHTTRKKSNKMMFLLLREGLQTVQAVLLENADHKITREMIKYCSKIPPESVIDIFATVKKTETVIKAATLNLIELEVKKIFVVSQSKPFLPFQLDDASKKFVSSESDKPAISVGRLLRLNHRYLDVRAIPTQAIFCLQSSVVQFFREFLLKKGFKEIHTPKIVSGTSEGGSEVFSVNYFEKKACLAQSPQLYKQMAISCGLSRVFEIGPVFRAENSNTHRHLTEFTGLDFEMAIYENYEEIMTLAGDMFVHIFDRLKESCFEEIEAVKEKFNGAELVYPQETIRLSFVEAVEMIEREKKRLVESGKGEEWMEEPSAKDTNDFSTSEEKFLGKLIKKEYNTDFYIVYGYPLKARPFYTMPSSDNKEYTNSFDMFLRGEEITSGSQRIHNPDLLVQRAKEEDIPVESIEKYVESFQYGIEPHGGIGVGLERVLMLFLGLDNIRESSLFPRDPTRLMP